MTRHCILLIVLCVTWACAFLAGTLLVIAPILSVPPTVVGTGCCTWLALQIDHGNPAG